jgi:hypothetical protein
MSWVFRTMIVAASQAPLARSLTAGIAGPSGEGMFTTGLSASGNAPATHFVSSGKIQDNFAALLASAESIVAASGGQVTLQQAQALLAASDITQEPPFTAFARLGLQIVQVEPNA